ncbi:MAG: hypothetical protein ACK5KN_04340 [Dysgonomonas sp.]|uniref:hypothetical protein n=1 Tax=Dysgonomonas sp. TaxID=1891233 RepID=UPI003A8BAD41
MPIVFTHWHILSLAYQLIIFILLPANPAASLAEVMAGTGFLPFTYRGASAISIRNIIQLSPQSI